MRKKLSNPAPGPRLILWSILLPAICATAMLSGCGLLDHANDAALIASGNKTIPYVRQFKRLFPSAIVFLNYRGRPLPPGATKAFLWDSQTTLYGRYFFSMRIAIKINNSWDRVIGWGKPEFLLLEVKRTNWRATTYRGRGQVGFGTNRWKRLVHHHGRFRAIGIHLVKNHPVPFFRTIKNTEEG